MSVDTTAFERLAQRLDAAATETPKVMDEILQDAAKAYIRVAKQNTPVDTGTLRRNFAPENNHISGSGRVREMTIVNPIEYSEYVNYGHRTRGGTGWVEGYHMTDKGEESARKRIERDGPRRLNEMLVRIWNGGA